MIIATSCDRESLQSVPSRDGMPDQESWGVNIILTDQGIIRAKVSSGHLEKYNEKEFIMLDSSVIVDFYDRKEQHTSVLYSDKAEVDQQSNDMKANTAALEGIPTPDPDGSLEANFSYYLSRIDKLTLTKDRKFKVYLWNRLENF